MQETNLGLRKEGVQMLYRAMKITNKGIGRTVVEALKHFTISKTQKKETLVKRGIGSSLEIRVDQASPIENEFQNALELCQESAFEDENEYLEIFENCHAYANEYFESEIIAFYGKKIFEFEQKNETAGDFYCIYDHIQSMEEKEKKLRKVAAVKDLPAISLDKDFFTNAIKNIKSKANPMTKEDWLIPDKISFDVYQTTRDQFLIIITPSLETMTECRFEISVALPCLSDYAVIENLESDLKSINGQKTNCTFMLPERFIRKLLSTLANKPVTNFLEV